MKLKIILLFLMVVILFSCEKEVILKIENPLNVARTDEAIILSRAQVEQKLELKEGMLPLFKTADGKAIPASYEYC